jgi:hypothetical protein
MTTRRSPKISVDRTVVLAGSLALVIAGGVAAATEAQPFLAFSGSDAERLVALETPQQPPWQSAVARRVVLDTCLWATTSVFGRLAAVDQRQSVLAGCESYAADTLRDYPTHSFAAYIAALEAATLADQAHFVSYLSRSQDLGPNEGWIAELRVPLAEDHLDWLDQHAREGHDRDLGVLVQTQHGVALVARLYLRDDQSRNRIAAIVEGLPEAAQRRFVSAVRQLAART